MAEHRLRTPRLVLEPLTRTLARSIVRGDLPAVRAGAGWPTADTLHAVRGFAEHGEREDGGGWLVMLADTTVIGDCGTKGAPDDLGIVEIGYGLAASYRMQGYGTEAVDAMVQWLAHQPAVRRITAEALAANTASRRLLERLGFTVARVEQPHVYYQLDTAT